MLVNYFKIAFRNLVKHRIFSLINIAGLSIGIACCLFIFLFIQNEMNYDKFHENGDRIYRVLRKGDMNGEVVGVPWTSGPYGPALKNDFPVEIAHSVRVMPNSGLITYGDKSFQENKLFFADSTFFDVFSYPLLSGNARTALNKPNGMVISREMAQKYFGNADPLGKVLDIDNGDFQYEITGVMGAAPGNTHLQFDFVANIAPLRNMPWFNVWNNNGMVTYVLLADKVSPAKIEARLPAFIDKHMGEIFKQQGRRTDLMLQPLSEIYFSKGLPFDPSLHGDLQVIYLFGAVALFILAIACINFMNLSTARSAGRAKEVGMRKVMGAFRTDLVVQFLGESLLLTLFGVLLALVIVSIGLPWFSAFIEKPLALPFGTPVFWAFLGGLILVVGALAGMYPAFFLSAFQPIKVLKGKFTASSRHCCAKVWWSCNSVFRCC